MHPPIRSAFRQGFAQARFGAEFAFAKAGAVGQSEVRAGWCSYAPRLCLDCTPFPCVRSAAPAWRPDFFPFGGLRRDARAFADGGQRAGHHEGLGFHGVV